MPNTPFCLLHNPSTAFARCRNAVAIDSVWSYEEGLLDKFSSSQIGLIFQWDVASWRLEPRAIAVVAYRSHTDTHSLAGQTLIP